MALTNNQVSSGRRPLRWALLAGVFVGTAALGACSQVPDAVNPASWYRGTVDYFKGDGDKKEAKTEGGLRADRGKAPPGSEKEFPNLASVDEKARARGQGLSADPDRPKYAPAIPRQGESKSAPPAVAVAPAQPPAAVTMPPPAAAPTTPVVPAPVAPPAAAPAPAATATASAPMTAPAEQKEQEARLSQQLAEIRARAAAPSDVPGPADLPAAGSGTIVVSSAGIQTPGFAATQPMPTVAVPESTADGGTVTDTRGALPVPSHAVRVATILFADGSSKLRAGDKRILSAVSRLQRQQGGTIRVVGHASARTRNLPPVRHKMANFKVSVDRADSVAGELVRLGVAKEDILVAAVSDTEPVYYEFMPSGEAGNRRAEIYLEN